MDAALSLKFEKKAILPADPRTKLFLTVTVSHGNIASMAIPFTPGAPLFAFTLL